MNELKNTKIAMVGMGAVGCVVGESLHKFLGQNFFCVADENRIEKYKSNGLFVNGKKIDFNFVTPQELPICDYIIIATKNLQLEEALQEIKNGVGEQTAILSLLNGIQSEKSIENLYGAEKTLYGFIIDLTSVNSAGKISVNSRGNVIFGEKNNSNSARVKKLEEIFTQAGVQCTVPENIEFEMWKKFLINCTFNSLGAIMNSSYGGFRFEENQIVARKIGFEVVAVAQSLGIPLTNKMLEDDIIANCNYTPTSKCSMVQDFEAMRPTENDYFLGTIVRLAAQQKIAVPHCEFLYNLIRGAENAWKFK